MIHFQTPAFRLCPSIVHGFMGRDVSLYKHKDPHLQENQVKEMNQENLEKILNHFKLGDLPFIFLKQVHGDDVVFIEDKSHIADFEEGFKEGDALITQRKNILLGVLTADCAPILLADLDSSTVAAIHAGWRGALKGVLERSVDFFDKKGIKRANIIAVIGPCIGQLSYEVDKEVYHAFLNQHQDNHRYFLQSKEQEKFYFNLRHFLVDSCHRLGLGIVDNLSLDTYQNEHYLKSYRRLCHRQNNDRGNNISFIGIRS